MSPSPIAGPLGCPHRAGIAEKPYALRLGEGLISVPAFLKKYLTKLHASNIFN